MDLNERQCQYGQPLHSSQDAQRGHKASGRPVHVVVQLQAVDSCREWVCPCAGLEEGGGRDGRREGGMRPDPVGTGGWLTVN